MFEGTGIARLGLLFTFIIIGLLGCSDSGSDVDATTPLSQGTVVPVLTQTATQVPTPTLSPTVAPEPTLAPLPTATLKLMPTAQLTSTPEPTAESQPTATPELTATPTSKANKIGVGTHIVGTDIEPGIYMGLAGTGVLDSCFWERLSGLSGELSDTIANDNSVGPFYVEVSPTDVALSTRCELIGLESVPDKQEYLTQLPPGTYLVGRDIEPSIYEGLAGTGVLDSCYWERLSGVSGEVSALIANDNAQGRYFVQVSSTDFAVKFACAVTKVN